jgi:hypothetical protein
MIPLALGSGRMVVGSEITTSTTEHMAGIDAAPFLRYLERFVPINALVLTGLATFRVVGHSEVTVEFGLE